MNDKEYAEWMWKDTFSQLIPVLVIYGLALTAYWVFIG